MSYKTFQKFLGVFLLLLAFFYTGYYLGVRGMLIEVSLKPLSVKVEDRVPYDQEVDFNTFWSEWNKYTADLDKETKDKVYYNAITGMVGALGDPYTSYLRPDVNKSFTEVMRGNFQGIGAELGIKDGQLIVVSPLDGSPAKASGLKAGDKILKINEISTEGMTINEAVSKIRGPSGTVVNLTVQYAEEDTRVLSITRDVITIASVTWQDKGDGTAYIRISQFGAETNKEWDKSVQEINVRMRQLDAVVIDVRGNPGGYLQSAIHISEDFFRNKPVVYQEDSMGVQTPFVSKRVGGFTKVPVVYVLIDGGSASASEILSAALREQIGAQLIGVKSFGKGTIQDAKDLTDGSGVHITVAKWLTPAKEWIHGKGLEPDIKVERSDEQIQKGEDPQLDKALELSKKI